MKSSNDIGQKNSSESKFPLPPPKKQIIFIFYDFSILLYFGNAQMHYI